MRYLTAALILGNLLCLSTFAAVDCAEFRGTYYFSKTINGALGPIGTQVYRVDITDKGIDFTPNVGSYNLTTNSRHAAEFRGYERELAWDDALGACSSTVRFSFDRNNKTIEDYSKCEYRARISVNLLSNGSYAIRLVLPAISSSKHNTTPCQSSGLDKNPEEVFLADKSIK
jgi:hypothetical protein